MKKFLVLITICALGTPYDTSGQDLRFMQLKAHYSFENTASDLTGELGDAILINAPLSNDGVESLGGYIHQASGPDSSLVQTPHIEALFDSAFAIQLEFNISGLDGRRPVFVCGDSWRYLGFGFDPDSTLFVIHDGFFMT